MSTWPQVVTFTAILVTTTLATLRLLQSIAAKRREARWNRGQRVD
jgi:hypothetical protein